MASNPTRRGVRICQTCDGKVGYRSKICKHCSKSCALKKSSRASNYQKLEGNTKMEHETMHLDQSFIEVLGKNRVENNADCDLSEETQNSHCEGETIRESKIPTEHLHGEKIKKTQATGQVRFVSKIILNAENPEELEVSRGGICGQSAFQSSEDNMERNMVSVGAVLRCRENNSTTISVLKNDHLSVEKEGSVFKDGRCCEDSSTIKSSNSFFTVPKKCDKTSQSQENIEEGATSDGKQPLQLKRKNHNQESCHEKKPKLFSVQFVRIEPNPFQLDGEQCLSKNRPGGLKQNRLLDSNPTRRGLMLCPLCQKDVGCRSRTCKYCKVVINAFNANLPLDQKNVLAVQLCEQTCPQFSLFSVKKLTNASEERCFVKKTKTVYGGEESSLTREFSCDCKEGNASDKLECEHVSCLFRSSKVIQAKTTALEPSKIDSLPIDFLFKVKLAELWKKVQESELPLVQQVCQNTLVIVDVGENIEATPRKAPSRSCVHVRFDKIRRHRNFELHIFCSGKSCSAWNEEQEKDKDVSGTCLHYCICLWAIASDSGLQKYFNVFLEATQVFLHSEVFERTVKS